MRGPQLERTRAAPASRRGVTVHTGHRRNVAVAGNLDQDRGAGGQRVTGRAPGQTRQARARGGGVTLPIDVVPGWGDGRRPAPDGVAGRRERLCPSRLDQQLRLTAARGRRDQRARLGELRPGQEHLQRVRVRRPGFGVQVVTVVPDHHQPEVGHRRERRRAGADHTAGLPPARPQESPVPLGRTESRLQSDVMLPAEYGRHRRVQQLQVATVGHDGDDAASTVDSRSGGVGDAGRPVLAREHREYRPCGPTLAQRGKEVRPVAV
jgi:hypothetical protein